MAGEANGPDRVVDTGCPLRCQLRRRAGSTEHVDWAGLPVNLDFAFSPKQRDKVYAQHQMRKRDTQLGKRLHDADVCVCEQALRRVSNA